MIVFPGSVPTLEVYPLRFRNCTNSFAAGIDGSIRISIVCPLSANALPVNIGHIFSNLF